MEESEKTIIIMHSTQPTRDISIVEFNSLLSKVVKEFESMGHKVYIGDEKVDDGIHGSSVQPV